MGRKNEKADHLFHVTGLLFLGNWPAEGEGGVGGGAKDFLLTEVMTTADT